MIYLLDTSIASALMLKDVACERQLRALAASDEVRLTVISRGEILFGIERLDVGKRRSQLEASATYLFGRFPSYDIPESAGEHYARLKWFAKRSGISAAENDLWIAATVLALEAVIVSADRDFARLPGLTVGDWTSEDR